MKIKNNTDNAFDTMYRFLEMGSTKADYPKLKEFVFRLRDMMTQNTAGQRKEKPNDIDFEDLDMLKNFIVIEAMALVLSGDYEEKESEEGNEC